MIIIGYFSDAIAGAKPTDPSSCQKKYNAVNNKRQLPVSL